MRKGFHFYWNLFWVTFSLSAFTFGGGYVIVPLMRKRFVEEKRWLEDGEMLDMVAIAQSAPGIIAVNVSIMAGYRLAGVAGAMLATFATVLPPLIIISVISIFYTAFRSNAAVSAVMRAMQAGVAAVIADGVFKMGASCVKGGGKITPLIISACFAASYFFHVRAPVIIPLCAAAGAIATFSREKKPKDGGSR